MMHEYPYKKQLLIDILKEIETIPFKFLNKEAVIKDSRELLESKEVLVN